jgi:outer membrane receptor protein involved in Fe transport
VQGFAEGGYNSNYLARALGGLNGPLTVTQIAQATGAKGIEEGPSYKISASYKPVDNMTMYATYSTGFRAPSVNARAGLPSAVNPNDIIIPDGATSDELQNYEIGLKGNWFDGRLSANLAAYLIDWSNIQVQANRVSDSVQFATNIGKARSEGLELEISAVLAAGLEVGLNGSLNDSEVTELTASEAAISGAVEGASLAFPKLQGAVYAKYSADILPTVTGRFAVSLQYVGDFPNQFPNVPGNPNRQSPTYGYTETYRNVNLSLGADFGERLTTTLYVENVFDDDSITYLHPEAFVDSRASTLRPRTFGVRIGYDF